MITRSNKIFTVLLSVIFLVFFSYNPIDLKTFAQVQSLGDKINANVTLENKKISPTEVQKLTVAVFDPNSGDPIESAYVDFIVQDPRDVTTEIFSGLTDENGLFTHTWNINQNAQSGKYSLYLDIIAVGYKPLTKTETFTIISGNNTINSTNTGN